MSNITKFDVNDSCELKKKKKKMASIQRLKQTFDDMVRAKQRQTFRTPFLFIDRH